MYSSNNDLVILLALPTEWKTVSFEDFLAENGTLVTVNLDGEKGVLVVRMENKKETVINLTLPDGAKKLLKTNLSQKPDGKQFKVTLPANKTIELQYKYVAR